MKYVKKYENLKKGPSNFKEGDYVICIDNEDSILTEGMKYLVKKIFKNVNGYYVCKINGKSIGENLGTFLCDRFISQIEYNTNKFNL